MKKLVFGSVLAVSLCSFAAFAGNAAKADACYVFVLVDGDGGVVGISAIEAESASDTTYPWRVNASRPSIRNRSSGST